SPSSRPQREIKSNLHDNQVAWRECLHNSFKLRLSQPGKVIWYHSNPNCCHLPISWLIADEQLCLRNRVKHYPHSSVWFLEPSFVDVVASVVTQGGEVRRQLLQRVGHLSGTFYYDTVHP